LAGDLIVGFSGETEEEFQASLELVRRVEYKSIFVFKYSPRPGTAAERNLADDVPNDIKVRRNNELLALQSEIGLRQKQALVGQTVEVLVEGDSKAAQKARAAAADSGAAPDVPQAFDHERGGEVGQRDEGAAGARPHRQLVGRTPGDLIAVFDGGPEHIGALVRVRIERASPLTLFGSIDSIVSPPRSGSTPGQRSLPVLPGS
jgi:tRNA-2-methylthio-N6-dimethylallyladenosine synthase